MGHRRVLRAGFAFMMTVLLIMGLLAPVGTVPVVAQGGGLPLPEKNGGAQLLAPGEAGAEAQEAGAKATEDVAIVGDEAAGTGDASTAGDGPKNAGAEGDPAQLQIDSTTLAAEQLVVGPQVITSTVAPGLTPTLLTCATDNPASWVTTSSTFAVVRECTLTVPEDGYLYIASGAALGRQNGPYEAQFRVDIDGTDGDPSTDRWVNVYDDSGDGTDEVLALSVLRPVSAGTHTVYLLGRRYSGTGTVSLYRASLSVLYVPAASTRSLACGASGNTNWTTTSSSFGILRQCSLTAPGPGWVYIAADASMAYADGDYEAQFRLGLDNTSGDDNVDRWHNTYADSGDGTDRSMAISVTRGVSAGTHTFYLLGRRYSGTGTVLASDPTLSVIYVPSPSATALSCGASGNLTWNTVSTGYQIVRQCTITVPDDGYLFMAADASVGRADGPYEAQFVLGTNSIAEDNTTHRWVNVYDDTGDGTDKSMSTSVIRPVAKGTHTVRLYARRYIGTGTVRLFDPSLDVIYVRDGFPELFLPLVVRD